MTLVWAWYRLKYMYIVSPGVFVVIPARAILIIRASECSYRRLKNIVILLFYQNSYYDQFVKCIWNKENLTEYFVSNRSQKTYFDSPKLLVNTYR